MPEPVSRHVHADLLPQLLELDAVLHASVTRRAVQALAVHATANDVAMIFDVGAGTGAGTFALAAEYPGAQVVAVDVDQDMLDRVLRRAEDQEVAGRISTVRLDIGVSGLDAGVADVVWSSNAMHEVRDPVAAFGNIFRGLRGGGVLLVVEMDSPPLVLPREYAPLETALRAAAGADRPAPDWSGALAEAGFDLLDTRSLTSDQVLPAHGPGGTYASVELRRLAQHALSALTEEAISDLRELVTDLTTRHELIEHVHIRGTRTLWIARRP
jgi:ubiquinone/menaquinone biosynthesis C-methylase UbiE